LQRCYAIGNKAACTLGSAVLNMFTICRKRRRVKKNMNMFNNSSNLLDLLGLAPYAKLQRPRRAGNRWLGLIEPVSDLL
jgi:hypothetical protein